MWLWNHQSILSIKSRRKERKCIEQEKHRQSGYIMSDHNRIQKKKTHTSPNKHDIEKNNQKKSSRIGMVN